MNYSIIDVRGRFILSSAIVMLDMDSRKHTAGRGGGDESFNSSNTWPSCCCQSETTVHHHSNLFNCNGRSSLTTLDSFVSNDRISALTRPLETVKRHISAIAVNQSCQFLHPYLCVNVCVSVCTNVCESVSMRD